VTRERPGPEPEEVQMMTATARSTGPGGVRPAAVAGAFYPAGASELARVIDAALDIAAAAAGVPAATAPGAAPRRPKALIVPHAGYVYSGPVAATAYARLRPWRDGIERVVLLGPVHRVPVRSMAVSSADGWDTPLGLVPVDDEGRTRVLALPGMEVNDDAHAPEHSLEVELPFLQRVLRPGGDGVHGRPPFTLLPIVVGHAPADEVAAVLDAVWGGDETLVVISSDLSHYQDHAAAADHDRRTADNILAGRVYEIGPHDACGAFPVRGLLAAARRRRLDIELVDLRSSGDTAGSTDRVVGYGSFVLTASGPEGRRGWTTAVPDADRAVTAAVTAAVPAAVDGPPGAAPESGPARTGPAGTRAADVGPVDTGPPDALVATPNGVEGVEHHTGSPAGADWVLTTSDAGDDPGAEPGTRNRTVVDTAPAMSPADLTADDEDQILEVAVEAIRARLEGRALPPPDIDGPSRLRAPAATFVTLRDGRRLLGCIGSIEARRALLDDVADNAVGAAFRDPRMPALTPFEFGRMSVHVSVLTPPEPLPVASLIELREAVVPGVDGLLIEAGRRRGTFLPSVWQQVPEPSDFLAQLWRKAGLAPRAWPTRLQVWRYRAVEFGEEGPRAPIRSAGGDPRFAGKRERANP
jgi:AmmeMemoRadiSam system protein B/AmmeMemoRadiSam system protein A